jgi:glutaredoxin 2
MSTKVPQEYLDFDFGFTGVDEDEIKQDVLQELDAKDQALTEKEQELQRKIKTLEAIIVPLLNNLIKTSDRAYIHWPNRKDKCTEMLDLVLKTTRGLE